MPNIMADTKVQPDAKILAESFSSYTHLIDIFDVLALCLFVVEKGPFHMVHGQVYILRCDKQI